MTETALDVSVVICTYTEERWHDLVAAIESIQQQSIPPREIIVVVDNNTRLLERVQTHIPGIIVIENSEQKGLSGARNSGIAIARGSLIAFLDDDAIAEPDWLVRLSHCCTDPQVLGAGGVVEPLWASKRPAWFPQEFYWVVGCSYRGLSELPRAVRNPYGGCTCIRREVFEAVGGFRNGIGRIGAYPMGGEETELCIRAKRHWPEKLFLYEPQARIHHRIPFHRASWHYFRLRCFAEGLSKALVTWQVGTKDGLASECSYTLRILPNAVIHGMIDGFFGFDLAGFQRSGAIVAGLMITMAGYVIGAIAHLVSLRKRANTVNDYKFKRLLHPNR
jgi:GT2 family glycosyltransferase